MRFVKILDLHLGREITNKSLMVGLWLLVVYLFLALLDELDSGGDRPATIIALTLGYSIPRMIYELSPMILLIGTILGLAVLSRQYELIALQAGGVSKARLICSIVGYSAVFATVIFLWGEFVVPFTEKKSAQISTSSVNDSSVKNQGVWLRNENNFIYLNEVDRLHRVAGVNIYQFDSQGEYVGQLRAHSGLVAEDFKSLELRATEEFQVNNHVLEKRFFPKKVIPLEFDALSLALQTENPAALNVFELYDVVQQRKALGLKTEFNELALWNRLIIPLSMLVMGMFAVLFTFRRRVGMSTGHFVLLGLLFGLFYFAIQQSVGYIAILNAQPPIIGTVTVFTLFLSYALFATYRL